MTSDKEKESSKAKIVKPRNILKEKVGDGGLPQTIIELADEKKNEIKLDVMAFVTEETRKLHDAVMKARETNNFNTDKNIVKSLIFPVVQMKANGGVMGYEVITDVSTQFLGFIDGLKSLDADILDICESYAVTLQIFVKKEIKTSNNPDAQRLIEELSDACDRYHKKNKGL